MKMAPLTKGVICYSGANGAASADSSIQRGRMDGDSVRQRAPLSAASNSRRGE